MIFFVGDVHGKFKEFLELLESLPPDAIVIQVGDFGLWPLEGSDPSLGLSTMNVPLRFPRLVYMVDGNHEYYPYIDGIEEPLELRENLIYVPRGTVLEIEGQRIGFLGGADSIDKVSRIEGVSWFREETISVRDMWKFSPDDKVDLLVTHTPPSFAVRPLIGGDTPDPSSKAVEQVWEGFGKPPLVCGHMHVRRSFSNVHILEELGLCSLEDILVSVKPSFKF